MDNLTRITEWLLAIFFPKRCAGCGRVIRYDEDWCENCHATLPLILPPICPQCGASKDRCRCGGRRHHYDRICAPLYYRDQARMAIVRYKRDALRPISKPLAALMAPVIRRECGEAMPDMVTFIPSYRNDVHERGFNPSRVLAEQIAAELGIPCRQLLHKLFRTKAQKELPAVFRTGNVFGAFDVVEGEALLGKHILLIDDVRTTGATLNECAKMLKISGAATVTVAVAAITGVEDI